MRDAEGWRSHQTCLCNWNGLVQHLILLVWCRADQPINGLTTAFSVWVLFDQSTKSIYLPIFFFCPLFFFRMRFFAWAWFFSVRLVFSHAYAVFSKSSVFIPTDWFLWARCFFGLIGFFSCGFVLPGFTQSNFFLFFPSYIFSWDNP